MQSFFQVIVLGFAHFILFFSTIVFAQSAIRSPNEPYEVAAYRAYQSYKVKKNHDWFRSLAEPFRKPLQPFSLQENEELQNQQQELESLDSWREGSAYDQANELQSLKIDAVPEVEDQQTLNALFNEIRDERMLQSTQVRFLRRATWLYPDDGCFNRAALAVQTLKKKNIVPVKIFIFGNLKVKTPYSPSQSVSWWYHVVPSFRIADEVYVFDPAIEAKRPLGLKEWAERMKVSDQNQTLKFTICPHNTYTPYDQCEEAEDPSAEELQMDANHFLRAEFDRLKSLGRDPIKDLGDLPPWRDEQGDSLP